MIGQQVRMEYMQQVGQYDFRLGRHTFVKRRIFHVAIDDPFLSEGTEIGITRVLLLQCLIAERTRIAVHNAPVIGFVTLVVDSFEIKCHTSRTFVVFEEIVSTGVLEKLGEKALPSYGIPVTAPHLAAQHNWTFLHFSLRRQLLQFIVTGRDGVEYLVCLCSCPTNRPTNFTHSACPNGVISL